MLRQRSTDVMSYPGGRGAGLDDFAQEALTKARLGLNLEHSAPEVVWTVHKRAGNLKLTVIILLYHMTSEY